MPACTGTYRLRVSGRSVTVRHRSRDIDILNEIFGGTGGMNCYQPPEEIADRLDRLASPRIVDLGANIGLFGLYALGRWPSANLIGYEPDPRNAELLERTVALNRPDGSWKTYRLACSNRAGSISFVSGLLSESRIADANETDTIDVPMVDLFDELADVDLLKIDIEGAEWDILTDPRLSQLRADAIVLEWHRRNCPGTNAYLAAGDALQNAGYENVMSAGSPDDPDSGVLWAWR